MGWGWCALSGRNGIRGKRGGSPRGVSRVERRSEAGFVAYCKCPEGFKPLRPELVQQQPWRRGECRRCGAFAPEWRCPIHKLKAERLGEPGAPNPKAGCPRCGAPPREQKHDAYMTPKAKHG